MSKLYVQNENVKVLFLSEMQGQISDGMWENARPFDHWQPWSDLDYNEVIVDAVNFGVEGHHLKYARKRNYNFTNKELLEIVGRRMRFAVALCRQFNYSNELWEAYRVFNCLPESLSDWKRWIEEAWSGKRHNNYAKVVELLSRLGVNDSIFENTEKNLDEIYSKKELRKDLSLLKKAFKRDREEN